MSTDTFTIVRNQESLGSAQAITTGWIIVADVTKKTLTDIEAYLPVTNASVDAAAAIATSKLALNTETWTTWTATLTPHDSMTIGSLVQTYCKYKIIGKTFFFSCYFDYTVGGTPSTRIDISGFPYASLNQNATCAVSIYDNGAVDISGNSQFASSGTSMAIYKYDGSAYTTGAHRAMALTGHYAIA